jgi:hypothetical protein
VSEIDPQDMQEMLDGLGRLAAIMAHYVDVLMQAGFSREEALTIAIAWQQNMQASDG